VPAGLTNRTGLPIT